MIMFIQMLLVFLFVCFLIALPIGIWKGTRAHYAKKKAVSELVKHTREKCGCGKLRCPICDGGLYLCSVCRAAEGTLTTHCPGVEVPARVQDNVMLGLLDFVNGRWITLPESKPRG